MQSLRDKLFSRAGFARNQNGSFRARDALDEAQNFLHLRRFGDDFRHLRVAALKLRAQALIVDFQLLFFGGLRDQNGKLCDAIRFCQVIIRAELHRFDCRLDRRVPGQHDDFRRILAFFFQAAQESDAVQPRHIDVAQQNVVISFFQNRPRGFAVRSRFDFVTETAHFLLHHQPQIAFIVDN